MDAKMRIENAKVKIDRAKKAQTVAETQKSAAETQQAEVTEKLKALGVTPETAPEEIAKLTSKISTDLDKVEGLIPSV